MTELDTEIRPNKATTDQTLADTEYVVFSLSGGSSDTPSWYEEGTYRARSATTAVRDHLSTDSDPSGTYVAVPARSWKPVTVKAEQTVTLKLEQAK